MKLTTHPKELSGIINGVSRIPTKHPSFTWLERIALVAEGSTIAVRASNLGLSAELSSFADVADSGVVLVDAQQIQMALQGISDSVSSVSLEQVENELVVTAKGVLVTIPIYASTDMPVVPVAGDTVIAKLSGALLSEVVRHTVFAASASDIKPELASNYLQFGQGELVGVATDGFRLAEYRVATESSSDYSCMVPARYATEIARIVDIPDSIVITGGADMIHIQLPAGVIAVRTTNGTYPDYKQIIPNEATSEVVVLREDLQRACRVATNFTDQFTKIDVSLYPEKGEMIVQVPRSERGSGMVTLSGTVTGEEITVRMSAKNVLDALGVVSDASISLRFNGASRPVVCQGFHDKQALMLMMPMSR
jgi:DNA polymerase III subunit beta